MQETVVAAKLNIPTPGRKLVRRSRLFDSLNGGLHRRLTLISAPAGFGKTTLTSEWIPTCGRPTAWLSLDEGDSDPARFLSYLIRALRKISAGIGAAAPSAFPSSQPQPTESVMASLLEEIAGVRDDFLLVLDDYHLIDSRPVDEALTFLLNHLPPNMHLAIVTREDPDLPLASLRARDQLSELRAADLRFTTREAAEFLNSAMGLNLPSEDVAALESRTEGWIAGLHLAAVSLRSREDTGEFIRSFTGSNSFVMDFLIEEVLQRQPERVQTFLIGTSLLDRLSGPLCDAVLSAPAGSGQQTLEYLQRSNLFVVPLDSERRWYRYHHLFADLLRQQLGRRPAPSAPELHARASRWYEDNGMEIEAFRHAAAANDVERAERLVEGNGKPLLFRGVTTPVLRWLESLPAATMDATPSLWVTFASALLLSGRPDGVEDRLRAAEAALNGKGGGGAPGDLEGRMAVLRAVVAAAQNRVDIIRAHHQRALELLRPDDLVFRAFNTLARGYMCRLLGDVPGAERAFAEVLSFGLASGTSTLAVAGASSQARMLEDQNQLPSAAQTCRRILSIVADPASMYNYEANLGLARISYEWNDLDAALRYGEQGALLAPQIECMSAAESLVLLARVKRARSDAAGAAALLEQAADAGRLSRSGDAMPEVAAEEVIVLLHQGSVAAAARVAERYDLPVSRARVRLAQGNPSGALAALDAPLRAVEAGGSANERLRLAVFRALAFDAKGAGDMAVQLLGEALAWAEPGGFIRLFVDEGAPMAGLLSRALANGIMSGYAQKLLAAFPAVPAHSAPASARVPAEALSQREMDILALIARGCTNHEIAERLFLSVSTVKGHNQNIFGKLQVRRRTEAIARARDLGLV